MGDQEGTGRGREAQGTGFFVRVPSELIEDKYHGYVVTAHHVIDAQHRPGLVFQNAKAEGQLYPEIITEEPDWRQPFPDVDLAILPFDRPDGSWLVALELDKQILPDLPAEMMLAMPFHYVGLLVPLDRAMARSGTLGAVYQSGIVHSDGYVYDCHLGDCRSYSGFSGSPCFLEIAFPELKPQDPIVEPEPHVGDLGRLRYTHLFCGMVTEHFESAGRTESSIVGVVCMLTSNYIYDALMTPDLVAQRREKDEKG